MTGAVAAADAIREQYPEYPIAIVGSHASALPKEVLLHSSIDIAFTNEGVYAIHNLLRSNLSSDLPKIRGIAYRTEDGRAVVNEGERVVPTERLDIDLPGYA